jgi:hypothetical protein
MSSIIKVDQIQLADGSTPTAGDLGLNTTGSLLNYAYMTCSTSQTIQSATLVDTLYTLNYTPVSSNSIIVVACSGTLYKYNNETNSGLKGAIYRDTTMISSDENWIGNYSEGTEGYMTAMNAKAFDTDHTGGTEYTYKLKLSTTDGDRFYIYDDHSALEIFEIAG